MRPPRRRKVGQPDAPQTPQSLPGRQCSCAGVPCPHRQERASAAASAVVSGVIHATAGPGTAGTDSALCGGTSSAPASSGTSEIPVGGVRTEEPVVRPVR